MPRVRKNPLFHLEGADELNEALRRLSDRASGELLRQAADAGAEVIRAEAERIAPRDTGVLASNIEDRAIRRQMIGRAQIDIGPTREAWYARFVEIGTSRMQAKPFLRPAFDAKKDEAVRAVRAVLRRLVDGR